MRSAALSELIESNSDMYAGLKKIRERLRASNKQLDGSASGPYKVSFSPSFNPGSALQAVLLPDEAPLNSNWGWLLLLRMVKFLLHPTSLIMQM